MWTVRAYQKGDEDQIYELARAVWGDDVPDKERWMKGWEWAHIDNPAGTSRIWLAEQGNKLIGQQHLIMVNMKMRREVAKAGQPIDVMTHPEYRHQGISSTMGEKLLSEVGKKGIRLAYEFPNQQNYPVLIKSGWLRICAFQLMFKPLNLRNLLESCITSKRPLLRILTIGGNLILKATFRTRKIPKVDDLSISRVSYFDDRFDDFWDRVSVDYPIIVVRDKSYLNWRYVGAPNASYTIYVAEREGEICGYIVLGVRKAKGNLKVGYIYDTIAPLSRGDIIQCLISKAVEHFTDEKADAILSQMVANKIYRQALAKNGFIPRLVAKCHFTAYSLSSEPSQAFLKNPKNWFIQWGDLPAVY